MTDQAIQLLVVEGGNAYLVSARDVAGRKQAEEKIRQLNTELSQFRNTLDQTLLQCYRFPYPNVVRCFSAHPPWARVGKVLFD